MNTNNIQRTEFFDREKEKEEIIGILRTEPQLINFIYGPINSGKTTLISNLIENLPENYVVFYINLRQNPISTYKDFLEELFDTDFEDGLVEKKIKKAVPDAIADLKTVFGIPIPPKLFEKIFSSEDPKSAFRYLLKIMGKVKEHNKIPVLIIDELQVIGDLKVDGNLIYKLFNFFVALTKELHLCHVFALSSDSLFIEKVYNEAILKERCQYLLVDEFDKETTKKFLERSKISREEYSAAWNILGGKPGMLIAFINAGNRKKFVEETIMKRKGEIEELVFSLKDKNKEIFEKIIKIFENFRSVEFAKYKYITEEIHLLVAHNIVFVDPLKKTIRMQSKSDLIAVREILKEIGE
ncbi:MAG: hypothetical protein BWK75_02920 [Candidatus Altiarchaeales archaeon A3]|nr:MAG: hypothetical protein BWK75_02920 [Candidatus Altiarchaeales archaeon A3]